MNTTPLNVAPTDTAITAQGLIKRFGRVTAVEGASFTVAQHEAVVLWGANGAGKTTVLRCILGVTPFAGAIRVLGCDVRSDGKTARRHLGYVPQDVRLPGDVTVRETVEFYARLRRIPSARGEQLLEQWQLLDARRRPVRTLSGGMQQRLAVIIALLADPPILLLDEPTSNLDVQARHEFSMLLERLKHAGKTLVCCVHRIGDAWRMADRVIVLGRGRVLGQGAPEQMIGRMRERTTVCFTITRERLADAVALLEHDGWAVQRNGMQMWVSVPAGRKLEPVARLIAARIPVLDLELE